MSRWVIAIALSWSAWVAAQPAVAHARAPLSSELGAAMCGEGSQMMSWEDFTLAAEDHGMPLLLLRTAGLEKEDDEAPPAWCISPDDPRCAPRDQSAPLDGPRARVPAQDVTAMRWPELAADSGNVGIRSELLGAPRAGVGLRLERPPRA
jgi:hypothetical protein